MANSRALTRLIGGGLAAALVVASLGAAEHATAKTKKSRRGRNLTLQRINIANATNVPANSIVEMTFSADVDPATVSHAVIQVRGENATQTGFTKEVFGTFQVNGNVVRFYPRLPSHLRDPASPTGKFYPAGSVRDNAAENAGLQPSTRYQVRVIGADGISPLRSTRGRPLRRGVTVPFATASSTNLSDLYTETTYQSAPPPQFAFSNPPDRAPQISDQYSRAGGASDVPNDISVSLFCTKVPLSPTTARLLGNVELTLTQRKGDLSARRPIAGDIFVEQNFSTTLMVFQPRVPLADVGTYALRVTKNVRDLTENYDFQPSRDRSRLRAIYDWLAQLRTDDPTKPWSELDDPPGALIQDWPADPALRGVYKTNILTIGDAYPDEFDPRVMVLFSTKDEPFTDASFTVNFLRAEDLFDGRISTGEWDVSVPSCASGIMTAAGGTASDGDFLPASDVTIDLDKFGNATANFRDVVIPQGVKVTVKSSLPAQIRAINFTVAGTLQLAANAGDNGLTGSYYTSVSPMYGGVGTAGGGTGGNSSTQATNSSSNTQGSGNPGTPGYDSTGTVAGPEDGGRGGLGGGVNTSTAYVMAGGGGGGGARQPGTNGANGAGAYASWQGPGGQGGAGSTNDDLQPLVGAGGGGAGGNGGYVSSYGWIKPGGGGGAGGGAMQIQTARVVTIATSGRLIATGGLGGNGGNAPSTISGGPGGGGGGGSILVRSTGGYDVADTAAAFVVTGGKGGTQTGSYVAPYGGDGGRGYIRLDDPNGGLVVAGGTGGFFDPVGGGVPSIVYSKFADLGVLEPRIVNLTNEDIQSDPTTNDAIFVELQMTREHPTLFGQPDLSALDAFQNSTDTSITSRWLPLKVHDNSGKPNGVFNIPGYNPGVFGSEYTFPLAALNGFGYRFVRYRITFQLDDEQTRLDPLPSVDAITLKFQFNF